MISPSGYVTPSGGKQRVEPATATSTSPIPMQAAGGYSHGASPLSRVVLKRPHEALRDQYFIDSNWKKEGWKSHPEFNALANDHFRLMKKLQSHGVQTRCQGGEWVVSLNSMMVRDTCIVTPAGQVIECPQKSPNRIGDSEEGVEYLDQMGLTKVGVINPESNVRGSDFVFITKDLVVAGLTTETDEAGIKEVTELLKKENPDTTVVIADLRSSYGAAVNRGLTKMTDRLCCAISPVKDNVVVACKDMIGGGCCHTLESDHNIEIVNVSVEEWEMGCADLMTISPKKTLMRRTTEPTPGVRVQTAKAEGGAEIPVEFVADTEDDIPETEPSYRLKQILKEEYGIRVYYIYMSDLHYAGAALNPFLQPYKRD